MREMISSLILAGIFLQFSTHAIAKTFTNSSTFICGDGKFKCASQKCVPESWKCDGDNDCSDGSDEVSCEAATCRPDIEFMCKNKKCIPRKWKCDGEPDCSDGSDEENCRAPPCESRFFQCNNTRCIPDKWKCDKRNDCGDNSDEISCGAAEIITCKQNEFRCGDGACIFKPWVCDDEDDCKDKSDERGCQKKVASCTANQFHCGDNHCIPNKWKCDGAKDCHDGLDEKNCSSFATVKPRRICAAEFWQCNNGDCIKQNWECDGEKDCSDGSDEQSCTRLNCQHTLFACKSGLECVFASKECNGVRDCADGSDEEDCVKPPKKCGAEHFNCTDGTCIEMSQVCDTHKDCPKGEDDPVSCYINECLSNNGHCMHDCKDLQIGYKCTCRQGYKLSAYDQRTCEDINECNIYSYCHQTCTNTKGHYKCSCVPGYILQPDMKSCRAEGKSSWVYFANRHDIRKILPDGRDYTVAVVNQSGVVSFDFDIANNHIYWSDIVSEKIRRATLGKPETTETILNHVHTPDGLAFDWVANNIYWTDTGYKTIEVVDFNGRHNADLVNVGLAEPRAIALDPSQGFLYWSDWGETPAIEKISMDGAIDTRVKIISENIIWPNGLTIDLAQKKIYWIDAKLKRIEAADLNGENRVLIREGGFSHPFALDNFEDMLYWTDWKLDGVTSMMKFNSTNITPLQSGLYAPMDVKVWHPLKQMKQPNPCGTNNFACSHLCLLANHYGHRTVACKCPRNMALDASKKKCTGTYLTRGPLATATVKPTSIKVQSTKKVITEASTVKKSSSTKKLPSSFSAKRKSTTYVPVVTPAVRAPITADKSSNLDSGAIIGIVISIIFGIILVIFFVCYVKRRNVGKNHVMFYKDMSSTPLEDDFDTVHDDVEEKGKVITNYLDES